MAEPPVDRTTPRQKSTVGQSCDQCRERKVRCLPVVEEGVGLVETSTFPSQSQQSACAACVRRKDTCTYRYTYRKPGRPKSSSLQSTTVEGRRRSSASPERISARRTSVPDPNMAMSSSHYRDLETAFEPTVVAPAAQSIFGSARQALQSPAVLSFDYSIPNNLGTPWEKSDPFGGMQDQSSVDVMGTYLRPEDGNMDELDRFLRDLDQAPSSAGNNPGTTNSAFAKVDAASVGSARPDPAVTFATDTVSPTVNTSDVGQANRDDRSLGLRVAQIEEIVSWGDLAFFVSLHVRYQHALVPLCHQPSFARDMLYRRDQRDETFRCFLLSIVSYTICQCPMDSLLERMSKETLERLLSNTQKASRIIQIRHQMRPSLLILASTILDWITSQATTSVDLANNLLSDVRRLVYALKINLAQPREGMSRVELELSRRIFWEAYVIDKTNSLNGHPIMIHDADGVPPMPLEIDDEMLFTESDNVLAQPPGRLSYMIGFVAICKIFRWIYRCLWRHRAYVADPAAPPTKEALLSWISEANLDLSNYIAQLPPQLRPDFRIAGETSPLFGMQAANICITGLCLQLALLDLKSTMCPDNDITAERSVTARRVLADLEQIPLQCLAQNGESMRGKVLRVILALLGVANSPNEMGGNVWDWWNIYSRVQFLQIIPAQGPLAVPTRPQSPD